MSKTGRVPICRRAAGWKSGDTADWKSALRRCEISGLATGREQHRAPRPALNASFAPIDGPDAVDILRLEVQAAKSSIYFLCVASGEGMAYPGKDHERWLREAGFSAVKRCPPEIDHGALVATK